MIAHLQQILLRGSLLQVLLVVAFAGAVASLSSCTLARLPVMLGFVSTKSNGNRGFLFALAFSLGLILSYTMIGVLLGAAAHIASQLVSISQYLYVFLGVSMVLGGMFFAGLMTVSAKSFQDQCQQVMGKVHSIPSAFIFGVLFAFIEMPACPCCGAVLLLIASLITIKGSLLYSGIVFFGFAVGQSLPVLLLGISSTLIKRFIPKTHFLENLISFIVGNLLIISGVFLLVLA